MIVCKPEPTKDSSVCCCRWPWVKIDSFRIVFLGFVVVLYMFFGAAVFSGLERQSEIEAYKVWNGKVAEFMQEHNVSQEDLHNLLMDYEKANSAGVWVQGQRTFWDFPGALCFVATVISTIGYGLAAPNTTDGKIFLIFFGLIGCSAANLFFNLFLERIITLIVYVWRRYHEQKLWSSRKRPATSYNTTQEGGTMGGQEDWMPSVYHVTLILVAVCFLVLCAASGIYSAVEGWSYLESMYFCFVTFSTMGFGDMVSGQQEVYEANWFYQITNTLAIFLGVCCTYTLLNLISIMIKAMLNWHLSNVLCLKCCSGTETKKHDPLQLYCSCFMYPEDEESYPQQLHVTTSCFIQCWSCHLVKLSNGKCRCSGSVLQTVCQHDMNVTEKKFISEHNGPNVNVMKNSLHVTTGCSPWQNNGLSEMLSGKSILNNYLKDFP